MKRTGTGLFSIFSSKIYTLWSAMKKFGKSPKNEKNSITIKSTIMEVKIEVPEGMRAEWKNGVLTLVDDRPKDIRERVKTLEDAIDILGKDHPVVLDYYGICIGTDAPDIRAYAKLRVIVTALNEGWKPILGDEHEPHYVPYFVRTNDGKNIVFDGVGRECEPISYCSQFYFKTKELAEYCGKQFVDIWRDYLLG